MKEKEEKKKGDLGIKEGVGWDVTALQNFGGAQKFYR